MIFQNAMPGRSCDEGFEELPFHTKPRRSTSSRFQTSLRRRGTGREPPRSDGEPPGSATGISRVGKPMDAMKVIWYIVALYKSVGTTSLNITCNMMEHG